MSDQPELYEGTLKGRTAEVPVVTNCARCGREHRDLVFKRLTRKSLDFEFWCSCPTNGEPIMLKIQKRLDAW